MYLLLVYSTLFEVDVCVCVCVCVLEKGVPLYLCEGRRRLWGVKQILFWRACQN